MRLKTRDKYLEISEKMNYLGQSPRGINLETITFCPILSLIWSVSLSPQGSPWEKGAMGDDQLCFRTKFGAHQNLENHPPAHSVRFPLQRGTFIFFRPRGSGN